jgi:hypothetical protein
MAPRSRHLSSEGSSLMVTEPNTPAFSTEELDWSASHAHFNYLMEMLVLQPPRRDEYVYCVPEE